MQIILENLGRRFNKEWIFKEINYVFSQGQQYAILGPNGSGKSTLLNPIFNPLLLFTAKLTLLEMNTVEQEFSLRVINSARMPSRSRSMIIMHS